MQNNQEIIKKTKTSIAQEFLQDDGPRVSPCMSLSVISRLCYAYMKYCFLIILLFYYYSAYFVFCDYSATPLNPSGIEGGHIRNTKVRM